MEQVERSSAQASGKTRYFTGKPCRRGHISERLVSNRSCLACTYAADRADYAADPERGRAKCRKWREKNSEYNAARAKSWRERNPEKQADADRAWRRNNPDKHRDKRRRRKARKKGAKGTHSSADIDRIFAAQHGKCVYCRRDLKKIGHHVDHIVPLARGGGDDRSNLQLLCPPCNTSKGAMDPIAFAKKRGLLV